MERDPLESLIAHHCSSRNRDKRRVRSRILGQLSSSIGNHTHHKQHSCVYALIDCLVWSAQDGLSQDKANSRKEKRIMLFLLWSLLIIISTRKTTLMANHTYYISYIIGSQCSTRKFHRHLTIYQMVVKNPGSRHIPTTGTVPSSLFKFLRAPDKRTC